MCLSTFLSIFARRLVHGLTPAPIHLIVLLLVATALGLHLGHLLLHALHLGRLLLLILVLVVTLLSFGLLGKLIDSTVAVLALLLLLLLLLTCSVLISRVRIFGTHFDVAFQNSYELFYINQYKR